MQAGLFSIPSKKAEKENVPAVNWQKSVKRNASNNIGGAGHSLIFADNRSSHLL